jgi:hypothetical protein
METLKKEQLCYEKSSENFYDFMYNEPDTYFTPEKNQNNEKKPKTQEKCVTTSPYIIHEYSDDTIQVLRTNNLFPPRRNHEIIDVIDIGPQPKACECPDLINQDECSVSTNGDESLHSSCNDLPSLTNQQDDNSTAELESDEESNGYETEEELHIE